MKREIIFRGIKVGTKGEWVYGGYFCHTTEEGIEHLIFDFNEGAIAVYDHTVTQFTGLKDEKYNSVFDGDIVKVGGLIEVVTYIDGILCCYNESIYGKREKVEIDTFEEIIVASSDYFEPYEIIGNIYENPELLSTM